MSVAANVVEVLKNGPFTAGVGVNVEIQTYDLTHISVRYGDAKTLATITTHYTLALAEDFNQITVTPTAALVDLLDNVGVGNKFYVRRTVPLTNDFVEADAFYRSKVVKQIDKLTMMAQQLQQFKRDSETQLVTADYADNSITFAKLEDIAEDTIVGRTSSGAGNAEELTPSQVRDMLSVYTQLEVLALIAGISATAASFVVPAQFGTVGTVDDTAVIQLAIDHSLPLYLPEGSEYITTGLTVGSNKTIFGPGRLKLKAGSTDSHIDVGASAGVRLKDFELEGNNVTDQGNTGSSGIIADGASDLVIDGMEIHHYARHATSLDAVDNVRIQNNYIHHMRWGAGVLIATTEACTNVRITDNAIIDTQYANIHGFFGCDGLIVSNNYCNGTDKGVTVVGGGQVADNITFYQEDAGGLLLNVLIENNLCYNSGNHVMHVGGSRVRLSGNIGYHPVAGGLSVFKGDNTTPDPAVTATIDGNIIEFASNAGVNAEGINVRNYTNVLMYGNQIINALDAIQVNGIDTAGVGVLNGNIFGNNAANVGRYGLWLRNKVQGINAFGNSMSADVSASTTQVREDLSGAVSADNYIFNNVFVGFDVVFGQVLRASGSGVIDVGNQNGTHARLGSSTANVVNGVNLAGNATGSPPIVTPFGSDTDIDIYVAGKNAGLVRVGAAHSAIAAETVTGYLTIKDSAGTLRKIAVVS